jgi:hypothetical protein
MTLIDHVEHGKDLRRPVSGTEDDYDLLTHLRLRMNSTGEIVDVQHPLVSLMILLSGLGNVGSGSIQPGTLLFRFRWK